MVYQIKNGGTVFVTDENREDQLRRVIDEHLGRDMETCFNDVLEDKRDSLENEAIAYIEKKSTLVLSRVDSLIYHLDDYVKKPDVLKRQLEALKQEIKLHADNFELLG